MKVYMEKHQNLTPPETQEQKDALDRPLKVKNPDLYYENLHMEYYYFYQ